MVHWSDFITNTDFLVSAKITSFEVILQKLWQVGHMTKIADNSFQKTLLFKGLPLCQWRSGGSHWRDIRTLISCGFSDHKKEIEAASMEVQDLSGNLPSRNKLQKKEWKRGISRRLDHLLVVKPPPAFCKTSFFLMCFANHLQACNRHRRLS